jgi:hypothetical protein
MVTFAEMREKVGSGLMTRDLAIVISADLGRESEKGNRVNRCGGATARLSLQQVK